MADNTKIEWADATVNAVNGCSLASPGCTNCYAMRLAGTRMKTHPTRAGLTQDSKGGPVWTGEVRLHETALLQPLRWKRPRRIFWNAHGDLFHDNVPDAWIDRVFAVCALTPQHTHMILTKRSKRMREYMRHVWGDDLGPNESWNDVGFWRVVKAADALMPDWREQMKFSIGGCDWWPLPNVWLGVSVEDQPRADERREDFASTPAAIKFVSYEPALGPVDWDGWEFVDQIIGGGESGPKARPAHPQWFRDTRDFCADNEIAYFHKQNGEFLPAAASDGSGGKRELYGSTMIRIGKRAAGRLLDGVEHNGVPAHG